MQVPLIQHDRAAAQVAYRQYKALPKRSREDDEIMRCYRELAKGTPLIQLTTVMRDAGLDAEGLPKLAIARADDRWCFLHMGWNGAATFRSTEHARSGMMHHRAAGDRQFRMPEGTFGSDSKGGGWWGHRSMVPIIPPHLRPAEALSGFHILWEAEWHPQPPKDPLLLKRISPDLFAVLAVWDLTEVERAVLAKRFAIA